MARWLPGFDDRGRPTWLFPVVSIILFALIVSVFLMAAGATLGYDFEAYWQAAHRLTAGERLYDPTVSSAGGFAIYLYPPPFALAFVPFTLLPHDLAIWIWEGLLILCLVLGVWLMPVRADVRWSVVALAALNWPFLYSLRLGQVGPVLLLAFAAAWHWMDRAPLSAGAIAAGALIKVQPGLLVVWTAVTGRWRAFLLTIGLLAVAAVISALATGLGAWFDYLDLLHRVSSGVTAAKNTSPGAIAYLAGAPVQVAEGVQWLCMVAVAMAMFLAWRIGKAETSLQVTIVASQLLSPLLWEHYAMLLLLPTAWLLERGRGWAIAIPLLAWVSIMAFVPASAASAGNPGTANSSWLAAASIPLTFFACLTALLIEAVFERRRSEQVPSGAGAMLGR